MWASLDVITAIGGHDRDLDAPGDELQCSIVRMIPVHRQHSDHVRRRSRCFHQRGRHYPAPLEYTRASDWANLFS